MNSTIGKADLLAWINHIADTEYLTVQSLADGVGYSHLLDAIHPGCIALIRLNYSPRYPEDNLRNLKLVEDALKKLRIAQPACFQKMSKGMFQDNIIFLQWLFGYSRKNIGDQIYHYSAYEKRVKMLQRQGRMRNQMNPHLIPTQKMQEEWQAGRQAQQEQQYIEFDQHEQVQQSINKINRFATSLQIDLKEQMQTNWKWMFQIDKSIEERNILMNVLKNIDSVLEEEPPSPLKQNLQKIIHELPPEYQ